MLGVHRYRSPTGKLSLWLSLISTSVFNCENIYSHSKDRDIITANSSLSRSTSASNSRQPHSWSTLNRFQYSTASYKMRGSKLGVYVKNKTTAFFDSSSEESRKRTASLEQIARETINSTYHEDDPSVAEWFQGLVPSSADVAEYLSELFPSAQWIRRYNLHWLGGDIIAGTF
jgi:hypothetical protein